MNLPMELNQFSGTENWYRHAMSTMLYTDGVKYFAETAGAYWFVDMAAFLILPLAVKEGFASITLYCKDGRAEILVTDGNEHELLRNTTPTDCPEGTYGFYLTDNVLMLTSEY